MVMRMGLDSPTGAVWGASLQVEAARGSNAELARALAPAGAWSAPRVPVPTPHQSTSNLRLLRRPCALFLDFDLRSR